MKIAVVSKSDVRGGGASVVASNLTHHYNLLGHTADHFNFAAPAQLHPYGERVQIINGLKWLEKSLGYRDYANFERYSGQLQRFVDDYDVVHLHDMSTVYSHEFIGELSRLIPTFWTIHDCSPFTAGCLYPDTCEMFHTSCGNCPQIGNWPISSKHDRTFKMHASRRAVVEQNSIHFTAPSHWMVNEFLKGGYSRDQIDFVPNGVDSDIFFERDKSQLRAKYGFQGTEKPIILYSAAWLADSRKGPNFAAEIVRRLSDLNPTLLLVGRYSDEAAHIFQGLDICHMGFVKDEAEKSEYYSIADISLILSHSENAPLTVLESMACGTPVFGFDAGGVKEMVADDLYTFVHPYGDIFSLELSIRGFLKEKNEKIGSKISENILSKYEYKEIAKFYVDIFEKKAPSIVNE